VVTGGSDMRIRYWDLNQADRSYIVSDPSFKACNVSFGKPGAASQKGQSGKAPIGAFAHQQTFYDQHGAHSMATAPPLAAFVAGRDTTDQSPFIEEVDCSNLHAQYQSGHHCPLDQQLVSTAHHDTITDLLRVNQYLVSASRNGTVKVWR